MSDLHSAIRKALIGSSSQHPVDTAKLYILGPREQVEAVLQELYQSYQIGCCKIIKGSKERIVWYRVGAVFSYNSIHSPVRAS